MDFSKETFTTIRHRNLWGQWTFVFEKSKLCQLKYSSESSGISPSVIQASTYTPADLESRIPPNIARAYRKVVLQLNEYLQGHRQEFSIPYKLYGTNFQTKVWNVLKEIPFGETRSYKDIAEMVGSPKAIRAVGGALHSNPIPFILPCHRVIGKSGALVGFGLGLEMKRRLLVIEGAIPQEMLLE